ncbi:MAG: hypothetical protein K2Y35_14200 [Burkholderiales bacterium]|nr:hypothetical protein [Burkholderiales bacterium]
MVRWMLLPVLMLTCAVGAGPAAGGDAGGSGGADHPAALIGGSRNGFG